MKATLLAALVSAFSVTAFAEAPGYGYPAEEPAPIEQPCAAPCAPRPACAQAYCGGNVYQQVPQKVCQIIPVGNTRFGVVYGITRFGQLLTQGMLGQVQGAAAHYSRLIDRDGRPVCEAVY